MEEIWKDIEGYEWKYQISNRWFVKSLNYGWRLTEKVLLPLVTIYWYHQICLCKKWIQKQFSIHRLVAIAFIKNPENKPQVNHIDWDKLNNNVENLEWCTASENMIHSYKTWLMKNHHFYTNHPCKWKFWKDNPNSKKVYQYTKNLEFIKEWWSQSDVKRWLWIQQISIGICCRGKQKTAWWYVWKYELLTK